MKKGPKGKVIYYFKDNFNMQQSFLSKKLSKFWKKNYFEKKNYDTIFLFNSLDQNFAKIQPKKSVITMDLGYNLGVSTLIAFVFLAVWVVVAQYLLEIFVCWPCLPRQRNCVQIHYRVQQLKGFLPLGNRSIFI